MSKPLLPQHSRYDFVPLPERKDYSWPGGKRLAFCLTTNVEWFAFGAGLGHDPAKTGEPQTHRNYAWRDYGNRVGAWRCLELFDSLKVPAGIILNTALYEYCPELVEACVKRGDELIGHGHTNSERQGEFSEENERKLLQGCSDVIRKRSGKRPEGWLSPWISESHLTPDLLAETGYKYTLNWCHDDQPIEFKTRGGTLWSIPYPQELNDIPMIVARLGGAEEFADQIVDNFDEMAAQSKEQALVMGIALHPYIVGQPFRLRHLRRALKHIAKNKRVWFTTPGKICDFVAKR